MSNESDPKPGASEASEEKPRIKVTDRRLFDTDGNPRQMETDQAEPARGDSSEATPADIEKAPEVAAAPEPAAPEPTAPEPVSSPQPVTADERPSGESLADLPRDFSAFVESQFLEALIFLGAVPHPQTGETSDDPEIARYKIDLLTMIQEKTEGNLTADESRLIEDVIYQLRMLYVEKTKVAKL